MVDCYFNNVVFLTIATLPNRTLMALLYIYSLWHCCMGTYTKSTLNTPLTKARKVVSITLSSWQSPLYRIGYWWRCCNLWHCYMGKSTLERTYQTCTENRQTSCFQLGTWKEHFFRVGPIFCGCSEIFVSGENILWQSKFNATCPSHEGWCCLPDFHYH